MNTPIYYKIPKSSSNLENSVRNSILQMLNGNADQDIDGYDWPEKNRLYQSSTIEHLDDFISNVSSLFQKPELSDLTLVIENQDVRVNRSILAARCEFFHALLFNGMKETHLTRIELPTAELKSFKLLLRFIYSGKLPLSNLTSEELAELLVSARYFCLEKLVCDIALYLRLHINKSNVWLLYKVAKSFYIEQLAKACERFFDKNAESILQHEEFNCLDVEELKEMVSRDSFYASEKAILRAICVYYRNNAFGKTSSQCVKLLKELLEPVRLSLLSVTEIKTIFAEFKLPIYDPSAQEEIHLEKHRSALPINERNVSISIKRPSSLKSPTIKKKLMLATTTPSPVLTVAFGENQSNIPIRICDEIEELQCSLNQDDCSNLDLMESTTNINALATSKLKHFSTLDLLDITNVMRQRKESIRGYLVYNRNIATKEYKVEPVRGRLKKDLVCSSDRNYNIRTCTNHTILYFGSTREEYIQVAFGRPFMVNSIRMLLLDDGQRSFSYIVEVSVDGRSWSKIIDYSKYWCRSWQHLFFKERVVKHVRITGTRGQFYGMSNSQMSVVYFDCMYNTMDAQMYNLTDDGSMLFKLSKKVPKEYFIEPKTSVVETSNTIALTSSSSGTMRHFRLRKLANSPSSILTSSSISTSPNPHSSTDSAFPTDNSSNQIGSNTSIIGSPLMNQANLHYRTTDFARGSANWNSPGKIIFQLAQPFKIGSFAFKIIPSPGSTRSHLSYNVSISNDLGKGSWNMIKEISRASGNDLTVVTFEPQIVTFIEIRSVDYPNLNHFSVKHFECPYLAEQT